MKIPNWEKFQHYKERKPPWIKLHRGLLDNEEFACLPVASRALAPLLWILAADSGSTGELPSLAGMAWRLRMSEADLLVALKPLVRSGFVTDASEMLAGCKQDALPREREETETETEAEKRETRASVNPVEPPMPIPPGVPAYDAIDEANAILAAKRGGPSRFIADLAPVVRAYGPAKTLEGWRRFVDSCDGKPSCSPGAFAANARFWCDPQPGSAQSPEDDMDRIFARAAAEGFPTGGGEQAPKAPPAESSPAPKLPTLSVTVAPGRCPMCDGSLTHSTEAGEKVLRCADEHGLRCDWAAVWREVAA